MSGKKNNIKKTIHTFTFVVGLMVTFHAVGFSYVQAFLDCPITLMAEEEREDSNEKEVDIIEHTIVIQNWISDAMNRFRNITYYSNDYCVSHVMEIHSPPPEA